MSEFADRLVGAGRTQIGAPFNHHFKPENLCNGGRQTVDACMERGLNEAGYDCSGFVIASVCRVLEISSQQWPRDFRHVKQFERLAIDRPAEPGDAVLFFVPDPDRTHMGIASVTESNLTLHASGLRNQIEEVTIENGIVAINVVPSATLLELGLNSPRIR